MILPTAAAPTAPHILDCTLRDSSYAIDFQFSARDTTDIVSSLDEIGFRFIEVGHGVGLGASEKGYGYAAASDEEYMAAAAAGVRAAKWGMFCIPGVASLEAIDRAADAGMGFLRVGNNAETYARARPFIERARRRGLFVCANFMKSYCLTPERFADLALEARDFGADVVYVVDSAGGMLPEELRRYIEAIRARDAGLQLGFHGHNNLGLANANSYAAWRAGCAFIDSSLMGLGRSSGNAATEQLVALFQRAGVALGIDPIEVMDVADALIRPLHPASPPTSLDVTAGLALFHSSYMPLVLAAAKKHRVDPRRLMLAVTRRSTSDATEALVEECAHGLPTARRRNWLAMVSRSYVGREQERA